jgi:hypothetical protein
MRRRCVTISDRGRWRCCRMRPGLGRSLSVIAGIAGCAGRPSTSILSCETGDQNIRTWFPRGACAAERRGTVAFSFRRSTRKKTDGRGSVLPVECRWSWRRAFGSTRRIGSADSAARLRAKFRSLPCVSLNHKLRQSFCTTTVRVEPWTDARFTLDGFIPIVKFQS